MVKSSLPPNFDMKKIQSDLLKMPGTYKSLRETDQELEMMGNLNNLPSLNFGKSNSIVSQIFPGQSPFLQKKSSINAFLSGQGGLSGSSSNPLSKGGESAFQNAIPREHV
jgi:hypothetical protein